MGSGVEVVWRSAAEPVVALVGVEPVLDVVEGLAADVVDVGAAVAGVGAAFYQAGGAQDAKVLADEWLAASEGVREPGGGAWLVRERPHDSLACGVGEQVERGQAGCPRPPVAAGGYVSLGLCTTVLWFTRIACSYAVCGQPAGARRAGFVQQGGHF